MRDEKLHAVVARSTFRSQNVQNTPGSDHFWKLRCRKSARRCGAKHIWKSKCARHLSVGRLLEVEMSKKCTPLWREAHFEVKMLKTQGVKNTRGSDHFWRLRCRKSAPRCGAKHILKSLWRFRCRFASLDYTTLHYTPLHYTALHYTTLHSTTLQLQLHNYTTTQLHSTPLHSTKLHYLQLHFTTLHYTTTTTTTTQLHSTTRNYTTLHYITLDSTTLHYTPLH